MNYNGFTVKNGNCYIHINRCQLEIGGLVWHVYMIDSIDSFYKGFILKLNHGGVGLFLYNLFFKNNDYTFTKLINLFNLGNNCIPNTDIVINLFNNRGCVI